MFSRAARASKKPALQLRSMALRAPAASLGWLPHSFGIRDHYARKHTDSVTKSNPLLSKIRNKQPVRVAVTGAAGAIGYALLFRLCNGELLGPDVPLQISAIELPPAMDAMKGVAMEVEDCAFPLVQEFMYTDDPNKGFAGVDIALLVGSKPRGPGMERGDLIKDNGVIFKNLGQALNANAERHVRVTVVGNPCNTNALIAANNAPDIPVGNFTAMTRLDHDRGVGLLSQKTMLPANEIDNFCVWGNHSPTMYPDITFSTIHGTPIGEIIGFFRLPRFTQNEFLPRIQQRGAEIISVRGKSSAASAASACLAHTRDWCLGSDRPSWTSMVVPSTGEYGVPPGLFFSFPVNCSNGEYEIATYPAAFDELAQYYMERNVQELEEERDTVASLLPN